MISNFYCNKAHTLACYVTCECMDYFYKCVVVGEGKIHHYEIAGCSSGKSTKFAANKAFKFFRSDFKDGQYYEGCNGWD